MGQGEIREFKFPTRKFPFVFTVSVDLQPSHLFGIFNQRSRNAYTTTTTTKITTKGRTSVKDSHGLSHSLSLSLCLSRTSLELFCTHLNFRHIFYALLSNKNLCKYAMFIYLRVQLSLRLRLTVKNCLQTCTNLASVNNRI